VTSHRQSKESRLTRNSVWDPGNDGKRRPSTGGYRRSVVEPTPNWKPPQALRPSGGGGGAGGGGGVITVGNPRAITGGAVNTPPSTKASTASATRLDLNLLMQSLHPARIPDHPACLIQSYSTRQECPAQVRREDFSRRKSGVRGPESEHGRPRGHGAEVSWRASGSAAGLSGGQAGLSGGQAAAQPCVRGRWSVGRGQSTGNRGIPNR